MTPTAVADVGVEARLAELGLTFPEVAPTHQFIPVSLVGDLAMVSGHAPYRDGKFHFIGKVGAEIDLPAACRAAELAVLGCLASLKHEIGDLERVQSVVKLNGYVNSVPNFFRLPTITDAASLLLVSIFGEPGRHARTTVGVGSLPSNVAVELEMTVQLHPDGLTSPASGG